MSSKVEYVCRKRVVDVTDIIRCSGRVFRIGFVDDDGRLVEGVLSYCGQITGDMVICLWEWAGDKLKLVKRIVCSFYSIAPIYESSMFLAKLVDTIKVRRAKNGTNYM